jgi:hypothetical protein
MHVGLSRGWLYKDTLLSVARGVKSVLVIFALGHQLVSVLSSRCHSGFARFKPIN